MSSYFTFGSTKTSKTLFVLTGCSFLNLFTFGSTKTYETLQCLIYVFGFISELLHSWFDKNLPDSSLVKISGIEPQNVLFFMPGSVISEKREFEFNDILSDFYLTHLI